MPSDRASNDRQRLIKSLFADSRRANEATQRAVSGVIVAAGDRLIACLEAGHKVLSCGNGGSAGDAQHFSSELINRFERERRALPAIALTTDSSTLTAIANDYDYERLFSRQVQALGQPGDLLLAITTSGNSANILSAVATAHDAGLNIIALTGRNGGELARRLGADDVELRAAADRTARIQEIHLLFIHCLCRLLEDHLLGPGQA